MVLSELPISSLSLIWDQTKHSVRLRYLKRQGSSQANTLNPPTQPYHCTLASRSVEAALHFSFARQEVFLDAVLAGDTFKPPSLAAGRLTRAAGGPARHGMSLFRHGPRWLIPKGTKWPIFRLIHKVYIYIYLYIYVHTQLHTYLNIYIHIYIWFGFFLFYLFFAFLFSPFPPCFPF